MRKCSAGTAGQWEGGSCISWGKRDWEQAGRGWGHLGRQDYIHPPPLRPITPLLLKSEAPYSRPPVHQVARLAQELSSRDVKRADARARLQVLSEFVQDAVAVRCAARYASDSDTELPVRSMALQCAATGDAVALQARLALSEWALTRAEA